MNRKINVATLTIAALVGFSGVGMAQTSTTTAPAATTTTGTMDAANFGDVISAMQANKVKSTDLAAVTDASKVKIVDVSGLAKGENETAMTTALEKNKAEVTELQTAVDANAAIKGALEKDSMKSTDVVAATTAADGTLTLYVK